MNHVIILECTTTKPVEHLDELVAQRLHTIDGVDPMKSVTILTHEQYLQKYAPAPSAWETPAAAIARKEIAK